MSDLVVKRLKIVRRIYIIDQWLSGEFGSVLLTSLGREKMPRATGSMVVMVTRK
jgi:hypothetical protein